MRTVRLENTTGIPSGTKVIDTGSGAELQQAAAAIDVSIRPNEPVTVKISLMFTEIKVEGEARFVMMIPGSTEVREVAKVIFADGSTFEA